MVPQQVIDLRGDLHGRVADYVCAEDRAWFEEYPEEAVRHRPAFDHEFCDPRAAPGCRPVFVAPPPPAGHRWEARVEVRQLAPGFRIRRPYFVLVEGGA